MLRPGSGSARAGERPVECCAELGEGNRALDLFAGTGLVGIEALSRGAQHVTFVESDPAIRRVLKANLERCGYAARAEVKATAAARFLKEPPAQLYDIVFVDPPYHSAEGEKILPSLGRGAIIQRTGVVVIEHFHKNPLPVCIGGLTLLNTYRYGDTILSLYQPVPSECPA